mmetsp:Transcript_19806/g.78906  ORF Transcript_19806/g.78906 Transcript_19806/m.78906 type:complete len:263 (+) Transcript_19806:320-1108(+)
MLLRVGRQLLLVERVRHRPVAAVPEAVARLADVVVGALLAAISVPDEWRGQTAAVARDAGVLAEVLGPARFLACAVGLEGRDLGRDLGAPLVLGGRRIRGGVAHRRLRRRCGGSGHASRGVVLGRRGRCRDARAPRIRGASSPRSPHTSSLSLSKPSASQRRRPSPTTTARWVPGLRVRNRRPRRRPRTRRASSRTPRRRPRRRRKRRPLSQYARDHQEARASSSHSRAALRARSGKPSRSTAACSARSPRPPSRRRSGVTA